MNDDKDIKINKLKRRLRMISWILVFGGIVGLVGALATPHWRGKTDYNEGIFQKCTEGECADIILFDGQDPEIDAVRIISLISIGYIAISIFLGIFSIANQDVVTFLRALSFAHVIIAFTVYTIFNTEMTKLWGFYLGWLGAATYGTGFVLGTISAHCMEENVDIDKADKI